MNLNSKESILDSRGRGKLCGWSGDVGFQRDSILILPRRKLVLQQEFLRGCAKTVTALKKVFSEKSRRSSFEQVVKTREASKFSKEQGAGKKLQ